MECGEQADHESLFNESMQAVAASENYRVSYLESVTRTAFTQLHFASVIMLIFWLTMHENPFISMAPLKPAKVACNILQIS